MYFILKGTTRTRVLIHAHNEILVVKGWLGNGYWELPGGGLHDGEDLIQGAIREVYEETGITLLSQQLIHIENFIAPPKIIAEMQPFFVSLAQQPSVVLENSEIAEIRWMRPQELNSTNTEPATLAIITAAREQGLL